VIKQIKLPNFDNVELLQKDLSRHEYPNHYHESFCISLIKSGTLTESESILPTGGIAISHPFEVHDNEVIENIEYAFTTFYVSPDVFSSINKNDYCLFENKVIYDKKLFESLDIIATHILKKQSFNNRYLQESFFTSLQQLTEKHSVAKPFHNQPKPELIEEIKNHILLNLDDKISLENLANKVGMSKYKFIRWFKKHIGLTPFDFIILNRVISGQKMLREGKPLLHTAMDTGFYDQSHFTNYFKRFVGVTPKSYQTRCNIFQDN
jgi:AraC-like DNA-binding protein